MSEAQTFKFASEVARYVNKLGYQAHDNTVRNHIKARKLLPREDTLYHADDVKVYAEAHLKPAAPDTKGGKVAERIKKATAEKLEQQARREKIKAEKEEGNLIPREQYEADLAARARILKASITQFVERWLEDLVLEVGGDVDLLPQARESALRRFEDYFAAYAKTGKLTLEISK